MAFKMKGSPMKRNFSVGESPAKQISKPMGGPMDKKEDSPMDQFEPGDYYDTRSKSPAKQKKKTTEFTYIKDQDGDTKNEKGETQEQFISNKKKQHKNKSKSNKKKSKNLQKAVNEGMSIAEANAIQAELKKQMREFEARFKVSTDSISNVNKNIIMPNRIKKREKDASDNYKKNN